MLRPNPWQAGQAPSGELGEIIEAAVAQLVRPDLGLAFLGAQGDPWDAQHDMLAATCGTLAALLLVLGASVLSRMPDRSARVRLAPVLPETTLSSSGSLDQTRSTPTEGVPS